MLHKPASTNSFFMTPILAYSGGYTHHYEARCARGDVAGDKGGVVGYKRIRLDRVVYACHRLAFLYMTGEWPRYGVDHINGNRLDNAWENLRDVPSRVNSQNMRKAVRTNPTGLLGVTTYKNRYLSRIRVNGKLVYLGQFKTPEEAHQSYVLAKRKMHEGCTI